MRDLSPVYLDKSADEFTEPRADDKFINNPDVSFDSISDLMDYDIANSPRTKTANVLGFKSAGDGGGGPFFWDASKDKADHDGIMVIDPSHSATPGDYADGWGTAENTGSGCFKRPEKGYINPKWGGAKDDDSYDSTSAFEAARDYAKASNFTSDGEQLFKSVIYVPSGVYSITNLEILRGTLIKGDGMHHTAIVQETGVTGKCISTPVTGPNRRIGLEDLSIIGNGDAGTFGLWLLEANYNSYIKHVNIEGFDTNLYLEDSFTFALVGCHIHDAGTKNIHAKNWTQGVIEESTRIEISDGYNIHIEKTSLDSTTALNITNSSIQLSQKSGIWAQDCLSLKLDSCLLEGNAQLSGYAFVEFDGGAQADSILSTTDCVFTTAGVSNADAIGVKLTNNASVYLSEQDYMSGNLDKGIEGLNSSLKTVSIIGSTIKSSTIYDFHSDLFYKVIGMNGNGSTQDQLLISEKGKLYFGGIPTSPSDVAWYYKMAGDMAAKRYILENTSNFYREYRSPLNRRNEDQLRDDSGNIQWVYGRIDSDETNPGAFFIGQAEGGGSARSVWFDDEVGVSGSKRETHIPELAHLEHGIVKLGSYFLWVDSTGDLRIGSSYPSDLDAEGTIVGTQS